MHARITLTAFLTCLPFVSAPVWAQEAAARLNAAAAATGAVGDQVAMIAAQAAAQLDAAKTAKIYGEALITTVEGLDDARKLNMENVRDYWERKSIRFEETVKNVERHTVLNQVPLLEQRRRTLMLWERTFDDYETTQFTVHSGRALNMVLDQLNRTTTLAYSATPPSGIDTNASARYRLPDDLLSVIRIQVRLAGGPTVISLSDTLPAKFDWWPYALREPEFAPLLADLSSTRELVAARLISGDRVEHELLKQLEMRMEKLVASFYSKYPTTTWKTLDTKQMKRLFEAEAFLKQNDREVTRLADLGDRASGTVPNYLTSHPDRTVTTLCHWMLSHGLKFAPAAPGDEANYTRLFGLLRQYCTEANISPSMEWVETALKRPELLRTVKESDPE